MQEALLSLVDIIVLKWNASRLVTIKRNDPEEFLYQETLLSYWVQLCLSLLENNQIIKEDVEGSKSQIMKVKKTE